MNKRGKDQVSDTETRQVSHGPSATLNQLPSFRAAMSMAALHDDSSTEYISEMLLQLEKQCQSASNGDLGRLEAILTTQAHVLNSIFTKYVTTAYKAELLMQFEKYMQIALKAQNHCRQTIAVLGELQNPKRTTFIKQQNNAVNQQINQVESLKSKNSISENSDLLEKMPNQANELLETKIERMDERAKAKTK